VVGRNRHPGYGQVNQTYGQPVAVYTPVRYQRPTRWNRDGEVILTGRDRLHNPPWDGDGITNWESRYGKNRSGRGSVGGSEWHNRNDGDCCPVQKL
jgi:hypothetical protein